MGLTSSQGIFDTAGAAADAVRRQLVSAKELLTLTLEQVDRLNPSLNAIVEDLREQAMQRAEQADQAIASGTLWGPLHGVPVTIKESFAYKGTSSTWGMQEHRDQLSARTAPAVERLEQAGAIVIGKTNVAQMLTDWQTDNPVFGPTRNPWNPAYTAGGSSGGSAAAVAAGMGFLSLGSDIAGSIRVPAHFSGVYGHKPSLGLVSLEGHVTGAWDGSLSAPSELPVAGPLARSARDLELALKSCGGPAGDDAKAWTWQMPAPRRRRLEDFRVGCMFDDERVPVSSDVRAVYEEVIEALRRSGVSVINGWPPGVDPKEQFNTYRYLLDSFLCAAMLTREERAVQQATWAEHPDDPYATAACASFHCRYEALQRRAYFRNRWREYFRNYDVFLSPVAFTAAFPHDPSPRPLHSLGWCSRTITTPEGSRPYRDLLYWITAATLSGLPATVAPVGHTKAGLPVGIQIVGPMWEDATGIEFAALLGGIICPQVFRP